MHEAKRIRRREEAFAFIPVPDDLVGPVRSEDDLAEELGENFVLSATMAEEAAAEEFDASVPEDEGGPFVESDGGTEYAADTDPSNPEDAERAPLPSPMRGG